MTQEIFKRYEKKYMLTQKQHDALIPVLERQMNADHYGEHTISNIYFDTRDYELVRQSIEKPEYKEKLRLRAYGKVTDNSVVYAEIKKKFDGVVYKRRIPMTLCQARKYLYYGIRWAEESQILKEIDYVLNRYDLKPAAFVAYEDVYKRQLLICLIFFITTSPSFLNLLLFGRNFISKWTLYVHVLHPNSYTR